MDEIRVSSRKPAKIRFSQTSEAKKPVDFEKQKKSPHFLYDKPHVGARVDTLDKVPTSIGLAVNRPCRQLKVKLTGRYIGTERKLIIITVIIDRENERRQTWSEHVSPSTIG